MSISSHIILKLLSRQIDGVKLLKMKIIFLFHFSGLFVFVVSFLETSLLGIQEIINLNNNFLFNIE